MAILLPLHTDSDQFGARSLPLSKMTVSRPDFVLSDLRGGWSAHLCQVTSLLRFIRLLRKQIYR